MYTFIRMKNKHIFPNSTNVDLEKLVHLKKNTPLILHVESRQLNAINIRK